LNQIQEPESETAERSVVPAEAYAVITQANFEELDATVNSMMEKNADGKWTCKHGLKKLG
jgi:hypothetical protein